MGAIINYIRLVSAVHPSARLAALHDIEYILQSYISSHLCVGCSGISSPHWLGCFGLAEPKPNDDDDDHYDDGANYLIIICYECNLMSSGLLIGWQLRMLRCDATGRPA